MSKSDPGEHYADEDQRQRFRSSSAKPESGREERGLGPAYEFNPNTDPLSCALRRYADLLRGHRIWFEERWRHVKRSPPIGRLEDFELLATVRAGDFCHEVLVQHKRSHRVYAMKIYDKAKLLQSSGRPIPNPVLERRLLDTCTFPNLVFLYHRFQDDRHLYMTTEWLTGGSLRFHLQRNTRFCDEFVVFYVAQVLLALEFLHTNSILFRNLRPEAVHIDHRGYAKLTDLSWCKRMDHSYKQRTYTLISDGESNRTEYLAPEIILSQGYGKAADFWAFGILVFELLAGFTPFCAYPTLRMYERIVANRPRFPKHFSFLARQSVKRFLRRDLRKRAGNLRNGVDGIKRQYWFRRMDWDALLHQTYDTRRIMVMLNRSSGSGGVALPEVEATADVDLKLLFGGEDVDKTPEPVGNQFEGF